MDNPLIVALLAVWYEFLADMTHSFIKIAMAISGLLAIGGCL